MTEDVAKSNGQLLKASENGGMQFDAPEQVAVRRDEGDKLRLLWNCRRTIVRGTIAGLAFSTIVAFLIHNRYESSIRLMPPDQMNPAMSMMLAATTSGKSDSSLGTMASDLLGMKSSSALFVELLRGRTVQDDVITKFNLRKIYSDRYMDDARSDLARNTDILEDRRSGMISVRVTDKDPQRAAAMAQEYVDELDRLVAQVNTSAAHREKVFLEGRLVGVKGDLESAEKGFSDFASKNTALDVPAQGKAMIEAAAALEGQIIIAQTELQSLKQIYADGNVRVRAANARVAELQKQLNKLGGKSDETTSPNDSTEPLAYPSLRQLPRLGVSYADRYRDTKIQEAIFETLTREYELAKVQEAKETPSVKVVDPPEVPQKKVFPPRMLIMLTGTFLAMSLGITWILVHASWRDVDSQNPRKILAYEVYGVARANLVRGFPNGLHFKNGSSARVHKEQDRPGERN
jgi:uncharacterized protein involved in exopolysaccharide biosynthesis